MAIHAHSTPAPVDHRALLRDSAVPVPTPDLTAKPPAAMGGVSPELPPAAIPSLVSLNLRRRHLNESQRAMVAAKLANMSSGARTDLAPIDAKSDAQAAALLNVGERSVERAKTVQREAIPELAAAVDQGRVSVSAAAEVARLSAEDQQAVVDAATARACHMRRALEGALDHGTALLAALGLPQLVERNFASFQINDLSGDHSVIGDALDTAIATLDALDAPGMDLEDGCDAEHDLADAEHDLGWPACMSQVNLGRNTDDGDATALERHGRGFLRSGPEDAEDDDPAGGQQRDEDALFWSVDVGCVIGATVNRDGAHV